MLGAGLNSGDFGMKQSQKAIMPEGAQKLQILYTAWSAKSSA